MSSTLVICLIISLITVISYILGKIPMALTAVISLAAFVLFGCLKPEEALSYFGNANGIMIMSMFVVAAGLQRTKFVKTVANSVNRFAKGSIIKVMAGYVLVSVILSQFIQSPMIVFGIMAPMMIETCKSMEISPSKVMFPLGISAIATCSAFPLGSGATVAAELNGYLTASEYTDYVVQLTDPMKARLPLVIVCIIWCIFFAIKFAPNHEVEHSGEALEKGRKPEERPALAPFQEAAGYVIFFAVTIALLFQKQINAVLIAPTWLICFIGAVLMVVCGVLNGREALKTLNLSMYLLFVGAMAMSGALANSGAGQLIGDAIAAVAQSVGNPYIIGLVFFLVPFLLTQVMQNRGVMMIFIPIAIQACKSMGANPVGIIIMVQAACLTAFMTPMATPAVPMIMAEGGYSFGDMVRQSVIPAILFCVVSVLSIMTVFPLFG